VTVPVERRDLSDGFMRQVWPGLGLIGALMP